MSGCTHSVAAVQHVGAGLLPRQKYPAHPQQSNHCRGALRNQCIGRKVAHAPPRIALIPSGPGSRTADLIQMPPFTLMFRQRADAK
jgi:hypothetical protein